MRRLCSALLGCIVLSGCSISLGGTSSSSKKPAPTADAGALATAQADFFANRYTVAEADYRKYIAAHPADSRGHAAYALFLNYNRRFSEALAEAQTAIGRAPSDVYAAAVDTRGHDWSPQSQDDILAPAPLGPAAGKLGPPSAP